MEVVAEFGDGQVGRGRGRASKDVLDTADQLVAFQPRNHEEAGAINVQAARRRQPEGVATAGVGALRGPILRYMCRVQV